MKHCKKVKKKLELFNSYKFFMTDLLKKNETNILAAKEENFLNWNEILARLKANFGSDIWQKQFTYEDCLLYIYISSLKGVREIIQTLIIFDQICRQILHLIMEYLLES